MTQQTVPEEELIATIKLDIKHIKSSGGNGEETVILKLERDPVVKTSVTKRVAK